MNALAAGRERTPFRAFAVIPQKRFGRAKARLAPALAPDARRELAAGLFTRVLSACHGCAALAGALVATDGADVAHAAQRSAALLERDRRAHEGRLSATVDVALESLRARGATHALIVMADLPQLQARDLAELLAALRDSAVVIAPDAQRRGTSALGLRLDVGFRTAFGHPDSLQRHLREATRTAGAARVIYNPRLAFDLDTPEDLAQLGPAGLAALTRSRGGASARGLRAPAR
jgi:2-phospho-L-lactate/phosphoenolpyruvate guanylyltransferase